MSEYLELLKRRRDATPPPGNAPNVQSNVSFRKAIDYIERLENQLDVAKDRNKKLEAERIPEELFDGYAIIQKFDARAKYRTSADNVSDVLDIVVKLIKERIENV